jgi:quercetin dioxygenase-like cupin family protein
MRHLVSASAIALAFTVIQPAVAQNEEKGVPIVKAPYHRPVFTNEYVTLLNVWVPPGKNTGYHIHTRDQVSVNISAADMTNQDLGSTKVTPPNRGGGTGRATYADFRNDPKTHKASNVGPTPFHNISFIFNSDEPPHFTPGTRNVAGYTQIMDNARVRGWRIMLAPGEATGTITQGSPGIRIAVKGGEIAEVVPGAPDRGWILNPGEFFWQDAGTTRAIKNIGTTPVEFVEFELK